jgi:hypothetical protein
MAMSVLHADSNGLERTPGSSARNNNTPNFIGESFLDRMAFLDTDGDSHLTAARATNDVPSMTAASQSGLAARMRLLIRTEGSMASIARRCGFSEGAVRSWRDGQSDISRERCVVLARTLNVSLIWLITGEGPMRPDAVDEARVPTTRQAVSAVAQTTSQPDGIDSRSTRPAVDSRVLAAALRLLQSYVGLLGGSLNPMQRADVLAELYDILRGSGEPGYIDRLIAFHSTLSSQVRRGGALVA